MLILDYLLLFWIAVGLFALFLLSGCCVLLYFLFVCDWLYWLLGCLGIGDWL